MIWQIKAADKNLSRIEYGISKELGISKVLSRILINRGINERRRAEKFLHPSLENLANPFSLAGMEKAVGRIIKAKEKGEKVLIYGDYDVDGVSSVALCLIILKGLGLNTNFYIPERLTQGYGLHQEAIRLAHEQEISLIITVDCGITNRKEVLFARSLGIDLIITDHHLPEEEQRPEAFAIIDPACNPVRDKSLNGGQTIEEDFRELAGVGIAYKLMQALLDSMHLTGQLLPSQHLDLVALGTIADLAPLLGENRILVKEGLKAIKESKKEGIRALLRVSGLADKEVNTHHVGFALGPRINAIGRIASANTAVELLLTESYEEAALLAKLLDEENRHRQNLEKRMLGEVYSLIERGKLDSNYSIVLAKEGWHPGVAGIVASKIVDRFHRPTIILTLEKELARGSGRSIENFHLFRAVKKCKDLLLSYGGHKLAIGLSLKKQNLSLLQKRLEEEARASISEADLEEKIVVDAVVSLPEITPSLLEELSALAPFGRGNPRPLLASRNLKVGKFIRKKNGNLFCWLEEEGRYLEAVGFGMAKTIEISPGELVDALYSPRINNWNGIKRIQLNLKDIKPATTSLRTQ